MSDDLRQSAAGEYMPMISTSGTAQPEATFEQKLAAYDDAQHRFEVSLSESKEGDSPIALLKMVSPTNQAVAARQAVLADYEALKAENLELKALNISGHSMDAWQLTLRQIESLKALSELRKQACEAALKELNPQGPWKVYTEDAIVRQLKDAIKGKPEERT